MKITSARIETPPDFNLRSTIRSHGWSQLLPFTVDDENQRLRAVLRVDNQTIPIEIGAGGDNQLEVNVSFVADEFTRSKIINSVRHILRLDEDFSRFYRLLDGEPEFAWIEATGAGRLLRSPTVFEDLVKTICTTNCSWALTKKMTTNLVEKLGAAATTGERAFPTADAMASVSVEFYQTEIRAGYRSTYFLELAQKVAAGALDVESWLTSEKSTAELKREIKGVRGVGDYAAETLLKLLGRYDGLALDSMLRGDFAKKHNNGLTAADLEIRRHYERFGEWRGLVIWCEISGE